MHALKFCTANLSLHFQITLKYMTPIIGQGQSMDLACVNNAQTRHTAHDLIKFCKKFTNIETIYMTL